MSEHRLTVRTADQTRQADVGVDVGSTGADVIQAAVDAWALPDDVDYTLVNATTGAVVAPTRPIDDQVRDGDVLEVQPVLVAGA